uniref:Uncharacterized protein n=1 Tax=Monopterus albus TaxID=43700 RepID=A0A3Q3IRV1_MONAL
ISNQPEAKEHGDLPNQMSIQHDTPEESMIVSLYNYPSFGHTQLNMCVGERLIIMSDDGDFIMVRSTTTGRDSYIPTNYAARVTHRWLFTGTSRYKAEELLMQPSNQTGAFLIRESETNRDCVKHYRIYLLPNGWLYISPRLTFPSLHALVQHYSEFADGLTCRLTVPCFIQGVDNARPIPTAIRRPTINWKEISRRKRTESDHSLVSEGLREAISSYLQITDGTWDT